MTPVPGTLSAAEIKGFHDDGYVVVRGAFSPDDAQAMRVEWWAELAEVHGIQRDDRATWRNVPGDLKRPKRSPLEQRIATAQVRRVIDDLLGAGNWRQPRDWGRALVTFPEPGTWDVPTGLWHWDSACDWHVPALNALFVVSFVGSVAPRGGGTLILSGSPRLLTRHEAMLTPDQRRSIPAARRDLFYRTHPWLMALAGRAPSPPGRIRAFMDLETAIDGVPARVVELTGEPGDMVFCHPAIVHSVAPNRGAAPRFMRIKGQLMTHAGQALLSRAMHPR
ncbi:MAG: hypothetical protein ABI655_15680 [Phenylobacterium sp.]